jgi:hypothetical protein
MYSVRVSNRLANPVFVYFLSASLLCVLLHHGLKPLAHSFENTASLGERDDRYFAAGEDQDGYVPAKLEKSEVEKVRNSQRFYVRLLHVGMK